MLSLLDMFLIGVLDGLALGISLTSLTLVLFAFPKKPKKVEAQGNTQ